MNDKLYKALEDAEQSLRTALAKIVVVQEVAVNEGSHAKRLAASIFRRLDTSIYALKAIRRLAK